MITRISFRFFVILTAMLTLCSLAVETGEEEDKHITLSFSIWYPTEMDFMAVDEAVMNALQDFFCEDIEFILLDESSRGVCNQKRTGPEEGETSFSTNFATNSSMLEFLKNTNPDRTIEIENARFSDYTDEILYMEDLIDGGLQVSILEGIMNQRLEGTGIIMRTVPGNIWHAVPEINVPTEEDVGTAPRNEPEAFLEITLPTEEDVGTVPENEWQAFYEINSPIEEEEGEDNIIHLDPELEFTKPAVILRYIGIAMILLSLSTAIILTYLGRRYRIKKELKELSLPDPEEQRGLVTEQGVNLMLEIGRRESERMSSNTSASA
ncbi:hypothetical protein FRACYDRAFT_238735 [Fragilariopsis cylindrus CCMP1102]|uniref:Solute-binding protein family 3/N-terminal domain-containing protein n=1 Tax=Fragilariopsis cylindrus CCMP1102 TaxID=635003 RepID=A0A1E7FD99_9STRA|nr:hypothetical protein FRACYDRAFT_238735 [Fragilariopsis cylindrus CCMP1102]|eukprot:OEU16148.1 hypothetical protein FRACYDRAFT_238735 [Fragilariopsis cylindrus CCMP1102]